MKAEASQELAPAQETEVMESRLRKGMVIRWENILVQMVSEEKRIKT